MKEISILVTASIWAVWHNFERGPPKDHPSQIWLNLVLLFQRRRFKCENLWRTVDRQTDNDGCQVMVRAYLACGQDSKKSSMQWGLLSYVKNFWNVNKPYLHLCV
jgi:hypothetical protein